MRHWLPDFGGDPGNLGKILPDFFHNRRLWPIKLFRDDFDFAGIHSGGVLIQFGASGSPCSRNNFRGFMKSLLNDSTDTVGFLKSRSRRQRYVDIQRSLVECRQEFTSHQREKHDRRGQQENGHGHNRKWMLECPFESFRVITFQKTHQCRIAGLAYQPRSSEQVVAQSRRDRQCDQQRGGDGGDICEGQRCEHPAFKAAEIQ